MGHWACDCPQPSTRNTANGSETAVQVVVGTQPYRYPRGRVHDAVFDGKPVDCILDTGAEYSLVGKRQVAMLPQGPAQRRSVTAGGQPYLVVGTASYIFRVDGQTISAMLNISPGHEGVVLGKDWMVDTACAWNEEEGMVLPLVRGLPSGASRSRMSTCYGLEGLRRRSPGCDRLGTGKTGPGTIAESGRFSLQCDLTSFRFDRLDDRTQGTSPEQGMEGKQPCLRGRLDSFRLEYQNGSRLQRNQNLSRSQSHRYQ